MMVDIESFAQGLSAIPEEYFTDEAVLAYMREHPVAIESLEPYLYFSKERYTRNLILHTELFDLLALCWDVGQISRIHNHTNQRCWMGVATGKVQVQNYRVVHEDAAAQLCQLVPTDRYVIDVESPAEVDSGEPIHLVMNPPGFGARAVTLHIYSRPFNQCEVYDLQTGQYKTVQLSNVSEYGALCPGVDAGEVEKWAESSLAR